MKWIKNMFSYPSLEEVIKRELVEARLDLLKAETAMDWAQSECDYNYSRIDRLEKKLKQYAS